MDNVISEYQKWKKQGEQLRTQARQAMEARFHELLSEAMQIAQEYHRDFGAPLVLTHGDDISDADRLAEHGFDELHLSRRLTHAAVADPDARDTATDLVRRAHGHGLLVAASGVNDASASLGYEGVQNARSVIPGNSGGAVCAVFRWLICHS